MRHATPSTADRMRGRHLPLKGGGDGEQHSSVPSKEDGKGGGDVARICLGTITGPHGVRGLVRIKSFTATPEAIADYGPLQSESGAQQFDLELVGANKGVLIGRLAGVKDRNAAERLKGVRLYVRRADLPPPGADEFYQADLIGMSATRSDGTKLGTVCAVHDFGAGASLEIEDADGKTMLVPFTTAAVPQINIANGTLIVAPPEELVVTPAPVEEKV